ncbi:MAG TPA: hypothetical protein VE685_12015 [Thermoanaerobaculia bacterium]|nr:hypothetical protein [Thermoanaerobaculia bacterium]
MNAQPIIRHGIDAFRTPSIPPTDMDFGTDPIPAGFFCSGSEPFTKTLHLVGVPVDTVPANVLNGADTVIERLQDVNLISGSGSTAVVVRALRLTGADTIIVSCPDEGETEWKVDACLCGNQPTSQLHLTFDAACGCGVANGSLRLNVCLRFTRVDTGEVLGPLSRPVELLVQNMPWCEKAGPGHLSVAGPISVSSGCTDCDQKASSLPGTSNFYPGLSCSTQTVDCWTLFGHLTRCHNSNTPGHPHCVNPICSREQP